MTTATEAALRALAALLAAAPGLPAIQRNIALDQIAEEAENAAGATVLSVLILQDGQNAQSTRLLGDPPQWQLVHDAELDFAVAGPAGEDLETRFDDGLAAIFDAIADDPTLGGLVEEAEFTEPPERGLETWGAKTAKTAAIKIQLTYTAGRPF